jgi:hypothetical protein
MSLLGGDAQGPLMGAGDQPTLDTEAAKVERSARETIDNLLHNRIPSRTLGDLDKAVKRSVQDHALAGGMGKRI